MPKGARAFHMGSRSTPNCLGLAPRRSVLASSLVGCARTGQSGWVGVGDWLDEMDRRTVHRWLAPIRKLEAGTARRIGVGVYVVCLGGSLLAAWLIAGSLGLAGSSSGRARGGDRRLWRDGTLQETTSPTAIADVVKERGL